MFIVKEALNIPGLSFMLKEDNGYTCYAAAGLEDWMCACACNIVTTSHIL